MKYLKYLQEEYLGMYYRNAVFINPDKSELGELGDEARFIADFTGKKLYVWDASIGIHSTVADQLYRKGLFPYNNLYDRKNTIVFGISRVKGDKLYFTGSDDLEAPIDFLHNPVADYKWLKMSDAWLQPWFGSNFKKTVMEHLKQIAKQNHMVLKIKG